MRLYHFSRIDKQTRVFFKFSCAVLGLWFLVYILYAEVHPADTEGENLAHDEGFRHLGQQALPVQPDDRISNRGDKPFRPDDYPSDGDFIFIDDMQRNKFNHAIHEDDNFRVKAARDYRNPEYLKRNETNRNADDLDEEDVDKRQILGGSVDLQHSRGRRSSLAHGRKRVEADVKKVSKIDPAILRRQHEEEHTKVKRILDKVAPPAKTSARGEFGRPIHLTKSSLTDKEQALISEGYNTTGFNRYVSDLISLRRRTPDFRPKECLNAKFFNDLPPTSVIICFHNEAWSTLLRTVYSVLDNSPTHLLHEVILVDDFSDDASLGYPLTDHVKQLPKVRVIRASSRLGLIGARLLGTSSATAPVLTFLDSHVECLSGWLQPMLQAITEDEYTVPYPVINGIDKDNFQIFPVDIFFQGLFNWVDLSYFPSPLSASDMKRRKSITEPISSPTMPGGIFSISRRFFDLLGRYDPGLKLWGSENAELSFKVWMCNGTIKLLPCSHVSHVFRSFNPNLGTNYTGTLLRNAMRVAYVWMDDFKYFFFNNLEKRKNQLPGFGDVGGRLRLRHQLHCKNFAWYMNTVANDLYAPLTGVAVKQIVSMAADNICIAHSFYKHKLWYGDCDRFSTPQRLWYLDHGQLLAGVLQLGTPWMCLTVDNQSLTLTTNCNRTQPILQWIHAADNSLRNVLLKKCVELSGLDNVRLADCTGQQHQKWDFQSVSYSL